MSPLNRFEASRVPALADHVVVTRDGDVADVPRRPLRAAMETVNIQTPLGPFQFTPNHDVKQTVWVIAMDGKGGFTLVHQINAT